MALLVAELAVRWFVPVRNVGPSWTEYHPVYLQRLKKNLSCRRRSAEFDIAFTTNSLGFRGPEPSPDWKQVILFLGDSFTLGYGVSDGEEYPAVVGKLLEDRLKSQGIGVVNAGIGGAGNGYWVGFLRDEAEQYRPRFVVLEVCGNDFADNLRERLFKLSAGGQLEALEVRPPGTKRTLQAVVEKLPLLNRSYLYGLARQLWRPIEIPNSVQGTSESGDSPSPAENNTDLTFALVSQSLAICHQHGWPAVVLTAGVRNPQVSELRTRCAEFGVEVLEVPLKKERPELYFQIDGHWNPAGHQYVADLCADYITRESK